MEQHVKWYTDKTIHVDIDTGEIIEEWKIKNKYLRIKTKKNATVNKNGTIGHIQYTVLWRKHPQGQLNFSTTIQ